MLNRAKRLPRYAALIAFVLALAACGGGGSDSSSDGGGASDSGSSTDSGGSGDSGTADSPDLEGNSKEEQVALDWSEEADADAYNLYYATEGDIDPDSFQIWINQHNGEEVSGINGSPHTVKGLEGGTEYHFAVTPVENGQEGDKSNEVSATPKESERNFSKLNDTGIYLCHDGSELGVGNNKVKPGRCPWDGFPSQDAQVGRDKAASKGELDKEGAGDRGFDFTKIDAEGNELPDNASNWTCVRDNHTGLMWEVKTSSGLDEDGGPRDFENRYTWYDPDDPTNGDGVPSDNNTHDYVKAVNEKGLCGASNWRLPSVNELYGLLHLGQREERDLDGRGYHPMLDRDYFPNGDGGHRSDGMAIRFWTRTPSATDRNEAWFVQTDSGHVSANKGCGGSFNVRLVRDTDNSPEPPDQDDIPSAADDCAGNLSPTTPSSEFTTHEGGAVVRHETTGLEWKRCVEGMTWSGGTCTGSPKKMSWQDALQYAKEQEGWRLPNIKELQSIVERCRANPAVNTQVFPLTPSADMYSSSPAKQIGDPRIPDAAAQGVWFIDLSKGRTFPAGQGRKAIRLVRTAD